jgi:excisionase family DNA binding protein
VDVQIVVEVPEDVLRRIVRDELAAMNVGGDWLTVAAAASYTRLAEGTLRNAVSAGRLARHGEAGHALRFQRADLDAYMKGGPS